MCLFEFLITNSTTHERIHNSFNSVPKKPTSGLLEALLETLESNFTKFQAQHVQLLKILREKKWPYLDDRFYDKVKEWYQDAKGKYFDAFEALTPLNRTAYR